MAIAVVAFLDDIYDWNFSVKLAAQLLAALVAVGSGLYVRDYHAPAYLGTVAAGLVGTARDAGLDRCSPPTR